MMVTSTEVANEDRAPTDLPYGQMGIADRGALVPILEDPGVLTGR